LIKFTLPPLATSPPGFERHQAAKTLDLQETILIADDDSSSRELISSRVEKWGYNVIVTKDGTEAMTILRQRNAPSLAILDWMMPGMDGPEICRRVRETDKIVYIILLTSRGTKADLIEALRAGADDYLIKPFDKDELQARIIVGLRVMALQSALGDRVKELEAASLEIRSLRTHLAL
jgi:phosphoserine phosphatase RsbU/P